MNAGDAGPGIHIRRRRREVALADILAGFEPGCLTVSLRLPYGSLMTALQVCKCKMEEFFKFMPAGAADFSRKEPIPPAPFNPRRIE
jgi:hypothetical protein